MAEKFQAHDRYKYAMENIHDIIWELDTSLNIIFVSPNTEELSGYAADEMIGRNLIEFLADPSKEYIFDSVKKYRMERVSGTLKKPILYEVEFINKDGSTKWFEVSVKPIFHEEQFAGYIGTSRDISEKKAYEEDLKKYIEELEHKNKKLDKMATFDMLTGAYNRAKFEQDVVGAAEKRNKSKSAFTIIMFDIDGFKKINDQYGHKMGDVILQQIASVVKQVLREKDMLYRWGGDEFVILLQATTLKNTCKLAEKIRRAVEVFDFGIESDKITISLGLGEYLQGDSIDQFLSDVDNALLTAKWAGKNRIEVRNK